LLVAADPQAERPRISPGARPQRFTNPAGPSRAGLVVRRLDAAVAGAGLGLPAGTGRPIPVPAGVSDSAPFSAPWSWAPTMRPTVRPTPLPRDPGHRRPGQSQSRRKPRHCRGPQGCPG
jgi:hypothetical protein